MNNFTRDDLKQGMVCELRNGSTLTILNNTHYSRDGDQIYFPLSDNYNDDLTHKREKDYDIMRVIFKIPERPESNLFFEPKKDETYYFINNGGVWGEINDETKYDDNILKANIVFKTREEAEKELLKQLLKQQAKIRLIKEIARLNDGWDVKEHWGNSLIVKYFINCNYRRSELVVNSSSNFKSFDNNLYLKTRELALKLIETHKDDLLIYFEVEK